MVKQLAKNTFGESDYQTYLYNFNISDYNKLDNNASFIHDLARINHKKLKKQYFKNNKQGIVNQGAKWNIGCFTETNIWHILKEMITNRIYSIFIYLKMVIFKCNKINLAT